MLLFNLVQGIRKILLFPLNGRTFLKLKMKRNYKVKNNFDQLVKKFNYDIFLAIILELIKIYLIGSNVPVFENRQKVLYHSTLMSRMVQPCVPLNPDQPLCLTRVRL